MKKAEEYWQEKNGGKSSSDAINDNELITPIYAVSLMESYTKQHAIDFLIWAEGVGDIYAEQMYKSWINPK